MGQSCCHTEMMVLCFLSRCWCPPLLRRQVNYRSWEPVCTALRVRRPVSFRDSGPAVSLHLQVQDTLSVCRCVGFPHAWYEQQYGSSAKSQWAEPVLQPALQSRSDGQQRLDAHAALTEQVPGSGLIQTQLFLQLKLCCVSEGASCR